MEKIYSGVDGEKQLIRILNARKNELRKSVLFNFYSLVSHSSHVQAETNRVFVKQEALKGRKEEKDVEKPGQLIMELASYDDLMAV